jgi:hypothetical protein
VNGTTEENTVPVSILGPMEEYTKENSVKIKSTGWECYERDMAILTSACGKTMFNTAKGNIFGRMAMFTKEIS